MGLISNGTTVFDAGAMSAGFGGSMTFIKKLTANNSATFNFCWWCKWSYSWTIVLRSTCIYI